MTSLAQAIAATQALEAALQAMGTSAGGAGGSSLVRPTVHTTALNLAGLVCLDAHFDGASEYDRFVNHVELTKNSVVLTLNRTGGGNLNFARYGLLVQPMLPDGTLAVGADRGASSTVAGARGSVTIDLTAETADGCPSMLTLIPLGAPINAAVAESFCPFIVWLNRNGGGKDFPLYVAQSGSYDWTHPGAASYNAPRIVPPVYQWVVKPKAWLADPPSYPLTPRIPVDPATITNTAGELVRINLLLPVVDADTPDVCRPRVARSGIITTGNVQGYNWSDMVTQEFPPWDELDGPRGIGSATFTLEAWVSHRPEAGIVRKVYGGTKLRKFKVQPDGSISTLFGLRNKGNVPRYRTFNGGLAKSFDEKPTIDDYEVVGNWDPSIPLAERYPKKSWFSCFQPTSVLLDNTQAPVSDPPGSVAETPHGPVGTPGPKMMCGDDHGFLLLATFDAGIHGPVSVKRLCAANGPWGGAVWPRNGNVIVSMRKDNQLVEKDWNGNTVRAVLGDVNAATFGAISATDDTFAFNGVTNAQIQSGGASQAIRAGAKICGPEGVAVMDDWCYFGSYAMDAVYRVDLLTGVVQLCCIVPMAWFVQSRFVNVAVSDGSFFPRHSIFLTTFDNQNNGMPHLFMPQAGTASTGEAITHAHPLNGGFGWHPSLFDSIQSVGSSAAAIYDTAVGIGHGMLVCGGSQPGLIAFMRKAAGDVAPDPAKMMAGAQKWRVLGYNKVWLPYGYAEHKLPLPWGEDPLIDYWLTNNGHVQ